MVSLARAGMDYTFSSCSVKKLKRLKAMRKPPEQPA
jgi:hypothetical protein